MSQPDEIAPRDQKVAALRESEERYRTLIESTHDRVQSVATDGHFLFVNTSEQANTPGLSLIESHPRRLCRTINVTDFMIYRST